MRRVMLFSVFSFLFLGSGFFSLLPRIETRAEQRTNAYQRWTEQAPQHYRLAVEIRLTNVACVQELEIRSGQIASTLRDTCNRSWLGKLTIERLFELSQRLERPPECFPSSADCACQRVRLGTIAYNGQFGFPQVLDWRRELRPNWMNTDYWQRMWDTRTVSACAPTNHRLYIAITAFEPMQ
jgi:hypothetical protein